MQTKFSVLRFISGFYKVIGIIVGVLTILSVLGICATSVLGTTVLSGLNQDLQQSGVPMLFGASTILGGIISAFFTIIMGALVSLGLYAFGELISLLVSLEENTRATVLLLQNRPGGHIP
jgi:hypothetical protein